MFFIPEFVYRYINRKKYRQILETNENILSYTYNVYIKIFRFGYLSVGSSSYLTLLI